LATDLAGLLGYVTIATMPSTTSQTTADRWAVYGHDWAVHLLDQTIQSQKAGVSSQGTLLRHAYLLLGTQQVGKTTLGRAFAQTLLCTGEAQRPCGVCRSCRLFTQGNHPDFRLVQPTDRDGDVARDGGILRADQASDIIRDVATGPLEGLYKFFLIQDFHLAHPSFANRLLKTLEEPPAYVILCLTGTDRSSLLSTIVSRCQVLDLRPTSPDEIAGALERVWHMDPDEAQLLARLSGGRLGWAISQLEQQDGLRSRQTALDTLQQLIQTDRVERLAFAESLAKQRNNEQLFGLLELWTSWWRDVLLVQADCSDACSNVDRLPVLETQAQTISSQSIQAYLRTLKRIEGYLHHTVNTRLALDVLLLDLPRAA
jgi:DNA polymerase-3 subunit delta'